MRWQSNQLTKPFWLLALILVSLLVHVPSATSQESSQGEAPAPSSVRGLDGPLARALRKRVEARTMFPQLKERLEEQSPFFRDTRVVFEPRTYYFDRQKSDGSRSEAWAIGGSVDYTTGWFDDWLSFGAGYYQSEKLVGDEDRDGTLLLAPGQEGFNVFGQVYAALRYDAHQATRYSLPTGCWF